MKIAVVNQKGEKVKDIELPKSFDIEVSKSAIALYVNYLRNALRAPIANTKDRSEVSGGGKKPWKQKGTGRARHGSNRSPLWVGGGVTFGPSNEQNFKTRINKTLKKKVILGTIGEAFKSKRAILVDDLSLSEIKTKNAAEILSNLSVEGKINLILNDSDKNAVKSFANIAGVKISQPEKLNVIEMMTASSVVMSVEALNKIEKLFVK